MRVDLGLLSSLPHGRARVVAHEGSSIIVVRTPIGARAYWNVCKHVPAQLYDGTGEHEVVDALVCRSHGARYTLEDGICFSGPCRGKWLDAVTLVTEGDHLFGEI